MKKFSLLLLFLFLSLNSLAANRTAIEKQLKTLSETLKEKKVDYEKIRQQYKDLMIQINNTDMRIKALKRKIESTKRSLNAINKKIDALNGEIGKVSAKVANQRSVLEDELKSYYEYSLLSNYYSKGVWFSYMNGYVTSYMQDRIKGYINQKTYLKHRIDQLNKYRAMKQEMINDIQKEQSALNDQKAQLKALASKASKKKDEYLKQIKEMVKQQENLKQLLKKIVEEEKRRRELLAKRKRVKEIYKINPKLVAKEFSALAKKIPPPVRGRIVGYFGRKYDPLFKVYTRNDGIDIKAKKGSCVRAIAYGKIDFVGNLPGYGGVVIINHLNGYYTVYGGVESLYKVGKIVKAFQCIGRLQSNKLHFEIRRHATPLNPLNFLDRRLLK